MKTVEEAKNESSEKLKVKNEKFIRFSPFTFHFSLFLPAKNRAAVDIQNLARNVA